MQAFVSFMNSTFGRGARIVMGAAIVALGLLVIGGVTGVVVAVIGLLPIVMGAVGHCLIGDIVGSPPAH